MTAADWPAVARIYAAGIAGGDATFEHAVPSWEDWSRARVADPRLVARDETSGEVSGGVSGGVSGEVSGGAVGDMVSASPGETLGQAAGEVLGWAALSPVSGRAVYRGVGAVSIYVDPAWTRRGVGRALLSALIEASERAGYWTLEAGIFPENVASVALHRGCGFEPIGVRRRIGQMRDGRWRDVALYERRSPTVAAG